MVNQTITYYTGGIIFKINLDCNGMKHETIFFNSNETKTMDNSYKTYYDVAKIVIWSDGEGENQDNGKRARMVLTFRDGNPRLNVYTGEPMPQGIIGFPMDHYTFGSVLNLLEQVANAEPGYRVSVDSIGTLYENNKPTNQTRVVSVLHMGKTKEGVVYLSVIDETKPKIIFPLKPTKWHNYKGPDKEPLSDGEVSVHIAKGLVKTIGRILPMMAMKYTSDEFKYSDRFPAPIRGFENVTKGGNKQQPVNEISSEMSDMLEDLSL